MPAGRIDRSLSMSREPITAQTLNSLLARLVSACGGATALISGRAAVTFASFCRSDPAAALRGLAKILPPAAS